MTNWPMVARFRLQWATRRRGARCVWEGKDAAVCRSLTLPRQICRYNDADSLLLQGKGEAKAGQGRAGQGEAGWMDGRGGRLGLQACLVGRRDATSNLNQAGSGPGRAGRKRIRWQRHAKSPNGAQFQSRSESLQDSKLMMPHDFIASALRPVSRGRKRWRRPRRGGQGWKGGRAKRGWDPGPGP